MEQVSTNIGISGAILSAQTIENFRKPTAKHAQLEPAAFVGPDGESKKPSDIQSSIAQSFDDLAEQWDSVRKAMQPEGELWEDISASRKRWIIPVLEALGYEPQFQQAHVAVDESGKLKFNLSHRAWAGTGPPYIHTVAPCQELDDRAGKGSLAPHDELQRYLNSTQLQQWGVITNGRRLRILRDFHHTSVRGYIEFDLDGIFETRDRADWRALYRLAHVSRLIRNDDGKTPLEYLYDEAAAAGVAIGGKLRQNVRVAIEELANGFLGNHPEILQQLLDDPEHEAKAFYDEVLQVVYRLLFLLYAEQRGLLPGRNQLYQESYSVAALRARSERPFRADDPHSDLWEGLKVTFALARDGNAALEVPSLGGELFGRGTERFIDNMRCPNGVLLRSIRDLALVEREGVLQRISYVDLGVDELGSIYEALLDYQPRIATSADDIPVDAGSNTTRHVQAGQFFLDPRGMSRKSSGTYYTNPQLVDRLIQSALLPVLEDRLLDAGDDAKAHEVALLDLKVVDPACGSGAFLIAAMNTLGLRLARIRTGDEYPSSDKVDAARHDVLTNCIYGVDLNPTTVTLAKVSLWIASSAKGEPLSFLDHRVRCGNSLIGATPELLDAGVPDDAFTRATGDDPEVVKQVRKDNREERHAWEKGKGIQPGLKVTLLEGDSELDLECYLRVGQLADDDPAKARELYESCLQSPATFSAKQVADTWTAAFFWPLDGSEPAPTEGLLRSLVRRHLGLSKRTAAYVAELAANYQFFHWHLEFPDVFTRDDAGFDVVLGNPPWDLVQPEEQKFFEIYDPAIATAAGSKRKALIESLPDHNPELGARWSTYKRKIELLALFGRMSGRYELTSFGKMNLYSTFAELDRSLVRCLGRVGVLVQAGIATDDSNKAFFEDCSNGYIVEMRQFENRKKLFEGIDSRMQFCLLTLRGRAVPSEVAAYSFFATSVGDVDEPERSFYLSAADLSLFNPNTRTCPTFRSRRDADIARKLYGRAGVFVREPRGDVEGSNPWGASFQQMINMTSESHRFRSRDQLLEQGYRLDGNVFRSNGLAYLPLYEAKLFHQYDHRFATFEGVSPDDLIGGNAREISAAEKRDARMVALPRYWVSAEDATTWLDPADATLWQLVFRDVARATDERTALSSAIRKSGVGNSAPLFEISPKVASSAALLLANFNSLLLDWAARFSVGGTHMNFFIVKQLPVLPPELFLSPSPLGSSYAELLVPRVLELTYTAEDLTPFARDLGYAGPPYMWNDERRLQLKCEIDGVIAHIYQIDRADLEWILDAQYPSESFRGLKNKEIAKWNEYRTMRLVLDAYDRLARGEKLPSESA